MRGADELRLAADALPAAARSLHEGGGKMQMAYAWFPDTGRAEVCYLAAPGAGRPFQLWRVSEAGALPSLSDCWPLLSWYERETHDLCGIEFAGHPEPLPLVLHEGAAPVAPPLSPEYPRAAAVDYSPQPPAIPKVLGPDVQELPWGPVVADVVESSQQIFFYLGEHILHHRPRLFFKHRGMEKRFQGVDPMLGMVLAERVSGVGSASHALAYCQAVEAAAGVQVPPRAAWLRCLLVELERLYNHLHYFGMLAEATTLKVGGAEGKLLEERLKQVNGRLTGSRFLRNLLCPGGLRRDLEIPYDFVRMLSGVQREASDYLDNLERTHSYLDRLLTTGVLPRQIAFDQGATGPVERASDLRRDLRRDHPYAAYDELDFEVPTRTAGDANARAEVRAEEIVASFALVFHLVTRLPEGSVRTDCRPEPGSEGLGWCENPRGALFYALHVGADGRLARVKIKSPSFSNWRVFPYTVHDTNMMDFAINQASFGMTVAGCDR
ncbi:MAG: NADH-quinone oxidoreductase subunit C [Gammaproteobacteria bacterium]|nr:NADH-quinone oxidoreductase subunit C [Gammaproteobacteria bacterium]